MAGIENTAVINAIRLKEQADTPDSPASGFVLLFVGDDGNLYVVDSSDVVTGPFTTDHGSLSGLSDDDHPQYLLANGTRPMSGDFFLGANELTADEIATPGTPATGKRKIYAKSDGWYEQNSSGVETPLGAGGGGSGGETHGAYAFDTGGFTLSSSFAYIPFQDELYDTDDFHDTVTNNQRHTIPGGMAGLYHLNAQIDLSDAFETDALGAIQVAISLERSSIETFLASQVIWFNSMESNVASANLSVDYPLEVSDILRVKVTKGWGSSSYTGTATDMSIDGWFSLRQLPALFEP